MEKEKIINLEEILDLHLSLSSQTVPQKQFYISAMRDACKQTLELAAENAQAGVYYDGEDDTYNGKIYKQSILNTINQIKLWKKIQ